MYRVELKAYFLWHNIQMICQFLMYRVELKVAGLANNFTSPYGFLMYRVELKEPRHQKGWVGQKLVPNVPCGVERLSLFTITKRSESS